MLVLIFNFVIAPIYVYIVSLKEGCKKWESKVGRGLNGGGSIATVVIEPSQSMDILEDTYLILLRKVASFLGFWPFLSYEKRFFRSCIAASSLMYAILTQLHQLLTLDFNLSSVILVLQLLLPFISVANIYYNSLLHFVKVNKLYSWMVQDWLELKDEIELKIMQKYMNETKLFPKICGGMFCIYISSFMLPSILHIILSTNKVVDSTNRYPIYSCFYYFLKQDYYYYFIVIFQILTVVLMTLLGICYYFSYVWYIQHVCARLSIVKNKLHDPFINYNQNSNVLSIQNDRSHWMIDIIQHLARTVEFMALVNKFGENCYLFQMSMVFLILVVTLLSIPTLIKHKKGLNDALAYLLFMMATVLPAYVNCFLGQRLIDYSMEVYKEMCLVPFHEVSLKTQKLLLIGLIMNSKPCTISIGKMFVSSHGFFSELLRTSVSFAMVLHSLQNV